MTGVVSGLMTLFLLILFLGIVFWAYSKRNKQTFADMAALPLQDDMTVDSNTVSKEAPHE